MDRRRLFDDKTASYIGSSYWVSVTVGRVVAVLLTRRTSGRHIVSVCMAASAVPMLLLIVLPDNTTAFWCISVTTILRRKSHPSGTYTCSCTLMD
jgi:fucose permease